jgi:hypothetical protein
MTLTPCTEPNAAEWITASELPWQQLVSFGPADFQAYARLRFLPDPTSEGEGEGDVPIAAGRLSETEQLQLVLTVLRIHSRTPQELYFCFWEGVWDATVSGSKVDVPNRSYLLFQGHASELGEWGASASETRGRRPEFPDPAFIWPADHAWCVANDIDPHWAGIGASTEAMGQLMADPRLDIVLVDPTLDQPYYR